MHTAGLAIYRTALADPFVRHITLLSRHPLPSWAVLPEDAPSRTTMIMHNNFLKYPPDVARQLAAHDACIWALGKMSVGMTEVQYTELTHGYTMAAVWALCDVSAGEDKEGEPFCFVYISGEGADQSDSRWLPLFSRVKVCAIGWVRCTTGPLNAFSGEDQEGPH